MQSTDKFSSHNQPLLTIAIPTYNRAKYLDLCLKRISEEIAGLSEDQRCLVKIYVSDNASSDGATPKVIAQYQGMQAGAFEAVRNLVNVGPDKNIAQCYDSTVTPYVWIMGDDDFILPYKLKRVLDILAKQNIDILYLKGYGYSDDYLDEPKRGRGCAGVVEYSNALDFVKRTHVMLTFITALIVRSGVKTESMSQVLAGSNLLQLSWILQLVRDGKKFAITKDRVYAAKLENVSYEVRHLGSSKGYGAINIFGCNLTNIANNLLKDQLPVARAIQNGAIVTWFPIYIMSFRQSEAGYLKEDVAMEMRRVFNGNWRYYVFLVPLIFLPLRFARLYFLCVRIVRKLLGTILI